jgi:uncharacterized protein YndB with AHSA1/START domain
VGHRFEITRYIEVEATPEQIWDAIATGPGMNSWFMGRNDIEPREGGTARWSIGDFTAESRVTTWDPPRRFAFTGEPAPDGAFHRFDYRVEQRPGGKSTIRYEHTGMLGDDWEAEYEAMRQGDPMYVHKLQQYLTYFPGRYATSVEAIGPNVEDLDTAMAVFRATLGLADDVSEDDPAKFDGPGLPSIDGNVDWVSPNFIGIRTSDALYRFIYAFDGRVMVGHHLFSAGVDRSQSERAWSSWLERSFAASSDGA